MKFNTVHGVIYIPAYITINLVESVGLDKSYIRSNTFVALVDHSLEETIQIIRDSHFNYNQSGKL